MTDPLGEAHFVVTSTKIGPVVFTATDVGDPALVASAQVEFIQRRVVVFAQGITTELGFETIGNTFPIIRNLLFVLGFSSPVRGTPETEKDCINTRDDDGDGVPNDGCPLILDYSYNGGSIRPSSGFWRARPYGCEDTSHQIEHSISQLGNLLSLFAQLNPNTKFIVIGHSQGGLIALHAARFVGTLGTGIIDTIITLDAALGGAPRFETFIGNIFSCWGNPAARDLIRLWNSATDHNRQGTTAKFPGQPDNASLVRAAQAMGTRVITIGNNHDCVWNPILCEPLSNRDNTSTQIVENADVPTLLNLGGDCILVPECISNSHELVLEHPTVLQIIKDVVRSPTVP